MKKTHKSSGVDDKKLQGALKKLNVQPIQAIEEVNMFKADGNVIHFAAPKGTSALQSTLHRIQAKHEQFTLPSHPTPSPSTVTVRTRSLPSSSRAFSISSAQTRSRRSASLPKATSQCRRRRVRMPRTRTMMISQTWLPARTSRARSSKLDIFCWGDLGKVAGNWLHSAV